MVNANKGIQGFLLPAPKTDHSISNCFLLPVRMTDSKTGFSNGLLLKNKSSTIDVLAQINLKNNNKIK
jgi:hypothetical protein